MEKQKAIQIVIKTDEKTGKALVGWTDDTPKAILFGLLMEAILEIWQYQPPVIKTADSNEQKKFG